MKNEYITAFIVIQTILNLMIISFMVGNRSAINLNVDFVKKLSEHILDIYRIMAPEACKEVDRKINER